MLAHYRERDVDAIMEQTTIAQTLYLYDAAGAYVIATSPFGSGDGEGSGTRYGEGVNSVIEADEPGAIELLAPVSVRADVVPKTSLPDDVLDLIDNYDEMRNPTARKGAKRGR